MLPITDGDVRKLVERLIDRQEQYDLGNTQCAALLTDTCYDIADLLRVDRVSIWRFENNGKLLERLTSNQADLPAGQAVLPLSFEKFPNYFQAIRENVILQVNDVNRHSAMAGFLDAYCRPYSVGAMLDVLITSNFRPTGILSCEQLGGPFRWSDQYVTAIRQVGTLLSFHLDNWCGSNFTACC